MWKDTQGGHVQLPDDVCCTLAFEDLFPIWTIVLTIVETLRVEGTELTVGGDVVQPLAFNIGSTCRRRQQPLPQAALHPRGHILPKERAIRHPKRHEHARIFLKGRVDLPGIVGTDIDHIAGNHGTAIHFVSQLDAPDDVPPRGRVPVNGRIARLSHSRLGLERYGRPWQIGCDSRLSRLDACDAIQRPLGLVTQCGIVCGRDQRLPGCVCRRPYASERFGRADANVEELILQRFDQLRHSQLRGRADACEGLTRRPSDAGNRITQGSWRGPWPPRPPSDRWTPRPPPRRCGRMDPRAKEYRQERLPKDWLSRPKRPGHVRHRLRPSNPRLSAPVSTPAESILYRAPGRSSRQRQSVGRRPPHAEAARPAAEWPADRFAG